MLFAPAGRLLTVMTILASLAACGSPPEPADLVLLHGKIVTMDPARPRAAALAARGSRIVAVGSDAEIAPLAGPKTRVIDLAGNLAIPGFIEGHAHFLGLGRFRKSLDLRGTTTWDEIVEKVAEASRAAPAGSWILGRGWHQEAWSSPPVGAVEGYPTSESLDRVAGAHPVFLKHRSGHAAIASSAALSLAGITPSTADPPGGKIVRDASGRPTGVLLESAADRVEQALDAQRSRMPPEAVEAETREEVALASRECLSKGITTFADAGSPFVVVDLLRGMAEKGELLLRLWVMLEEPNERLAERLDEYRLAGSDDPYLTVRAIKRYMDGALGSRGAWLLEPYADAPGTAGLPATPLPDLEETARLALDHGFQLCIHAIGDRANRETLDLYERALARQPGTRDRRFRIEHAQLVSPADVPRFARLGVVAAMQGIHCTSDAPWVVERVGEARARDEAYVWRKLLDAGAVLVNGTDAPVEDVDPIACFHASVTRRPPGGQAFFPGQRMSREEALRSYTAGAGYGMFLEDVLGSLAPGKLADVTVLSRDILSIPDDEIPATRVLYTIVGGKVRFEAADR